MNTAAALIQALEATRDETLPFFALEEAVLCQTYESGKWSIRFLLHHLADAETVLYERIRRTICEPGQALLVFDQDAWAHGLDYSRVPITISRDVYQSVRNAIIYLAGEYYVTCGHLTFVHSTMGVRTLQEEFEKVSAHNAHHLAHIRAALRAFERYSQPSRRLAHRQLVRYRIRANIVDCREGLASAAMRRLQKT